MLAKASIQAIFPPPWPLLGLLWIPAYAGMTEQGDSDTPVQPAETVLILRSPNCWRSQLSRRSKVRPASLTSA